jgi:hypothetical protein
VPVAVHVLSTLPATFDPASSGEAAVEDEREPLGGGNDDTDDAGPEKTGTGSGERPCCGGFMKERGEWQAREGADTRHKVLKPLYQPYGGKGRCRFVAFELLVAFAVAAMTGFAPTNPDHCEVQAGGVAAVLWAYLLGVLAVRPCNLPVDNVLLAALSLLETAEVSLHLLFVVGTSRGWGADVAWAEPYAQTCGVGAMYLCVLCLGKDLALAVLNVIDKCRRSAAKDDGDVAENGPSLVADGDAAREDVHAAEALALSPLLAVSQHNRPGVTAASAILAARRGDTASKYSSRAAEILAVPDDAWLWDAAVELFVAEGVGAYWDPGAGLYLDADNGLWLVPSTCQWVADPAAAAASPSPAAGEAPLAAKDASHVPPTSSCGTSPRTVAAADVEPSPPGFSAPPTETTAAAPSSQAKRVAGLRAIPHTDQFFCCQTDQWLEEG